MSDEKERLAREYAMKIMGDVNYPDVRKTIERHFISGYSAGRMAGLEEAARLMEAFDEHQDAENIRKLKEREQ